MSFRSSLRRALWCSSERNWWFCAALGVIFAAVQVYAHYYHEMWRDELHPWALGRDANGFWDVLTGERRYDGHPFLWYYILHLFSRISRSYIGLHAAGVTIVVTASMLWLRYAPLPRLLRVLLLPSYYLLYEYGVVTRNYVLGVMLVFAFCATYHPLRIRYVPLAVLLCLIAATSIYGTLMSLSLGLFLFTRDLRFAAPDATADSVHLTLSGGWLAGLALFAGGLALVALTTWAPSDALFAPTGAFDITGASLLRDFARYWGALFPFKNWTEWSWWNIDHVGSGWGLSERATALLGLAWFAACLVGLARTPCLALAYALGIAMMMAIQYGVYPAGLRHLGHYFVLLLACIWLHHRQTRSLRRRRWDIGLLHAMLTVTLAVQCVTGVAAVRAEVREQFSGGEGAMHYIREQHLENLPMVGHSDQAGAMMATMLDHPMWLFGTDETSDFVVGHTRFQSSDVTKIVEVAAKLARAADGQALLVMNHPWNSPNPPRVTTQLLYRTSVTPIVQDEVFHVYKVEVREP